MRGPQNGLPESVEVYCCSGCELPPAGTAKARVLTVRRDSRCRCLSRTHRFLRLFPGPTRALASPHCRHAPKRLRDICADTVSTSRRLCRSGRSPEASRQSKVNFDSMMKRISRDIAWQSCGIARSIYVRKAGAKSACVRMPCGHTRSHLRQLTRSIGIKRHLLSSQEAWNIWIS